MEIVTVIWQILYCSAWRHVRGRNPPQYRATGSAEFGCGMIDFCIDSILHAIVVALGLIVLAVYYLPVAIIALVFIIIWKLKN
jgi:hypothetical protein